MHTLASYKDILRNKMVIVCGCGPSLAELEHPDRFITIGVNDVGRLFDPTYLVVLNHRRQFKGDRFRFVEESRARAVFTQLDLGIKHRNIVRFRLGKRGGTDLSAPDSLPYTNNSPYVALCLAAFMGARRIGLIGVDFTDHHFFGKTGRHPLAGQLPQINAEYARLAQNLAKSGIEVVNLSQGSRLNAFPILSRTEKAAFLGHSPVVPADRKPLNIVSYATTPVAGVPAILARCINAKTEHNARCVWAGNGYGNGVSFDGDVEWTTAPSEADALLRKADIVVVHNGKVDRRHEPVIAGKAVITMAHNYIWNVDQRFVSRGHPGIVVGQYQATLHEFKEWAVIPNPVPLWEPRYQPGDKGGNITICYTPSGKHERYPQGHRLYWHAKGYDTTMRILDTLAKRLPLTLEVIRGRQVSHEEALRMKQRAHIVIDECVTGSYHRNSLEGLAAGCVVVNGVGFLAAVSKVFQRTSGTNGQNPFTFATLDTLEEALEELIDSGPAALLQKGCANRQWMEENWDFRKQWEQFWMPVIEAALKKAKAEPAVRGRCGSRNAFPAPVAAMKASKAGTQPATAGNNGKHENKGALTSSIPAYWSCRDSRQGNFGDMLSPRIITMLSGRPVHYTNTGPRLFAVGSLLKFARKGDLIWGAGFIGKDDACQRGIRVYAVRGPLTRNKLLASGIECPEIYGDPALLLPWLYRLPQVVRSGIGIIPHYVDAERVRAAVRDPAVRIIDIRAGIEKVLCEANKCEVLLSSSLHGCIIGDAYGIPAAWVEISDKVVGGGFKFRDYYASTGREPVRADWRSRIDIAAAAEIAVRAPQSKLDREPLLRSFPYRQAALHSLDDLQPKCIIDHTADGGAWNISDVHHCAVPGLVQRQQHSEMERTPVLQAWNGSGENNREVREHRLAIFSAGTENYATQMATTLRSFMLHNEGRPFDYFVFGRSFSGKTRQLIARHGIRYVDMDLNARFPRNKNHRYPGECFWIFKGPDLFNEMGYEYSLSVDGDIWCNRRLDLDWLNQVNHIAGIDRGCSVVAFLKKLGQYEQLKKHIPTVASAVCRIATNSGVLFYNNKVLADFGFLDRLAELYNRSETAGIARVGDDSTLALFFAAYPDIQLLVLEQAWNAFLGMYRWFSRNDPAYYSHLSGWIENAYLVHHARIKPWESGARFPNRVSEHFVLVWKKLWRDTLGAEPLREKSRRAVRLEKAGTAGAVPVNCYWYRGTKPNVGDETAPYLLKKIIGLSPHLRKKDEPCDPARTPSPVLLSVGSVLRLCGPNTVVWGSGIRNIDQPVKNAKRFCSVRGPLTRRRLLQLGYECPETYGDPALLLPRFYRPTVNKRYVMGVIPHQHDYLFLSKEYGRDRKIVIINVTTTDVESVVRQVLSCDCTVSSTLHGLVISVAYGIPTRWLRCSGKIIGDGTKFYDFFSSLNPAVMEALDTSSVTLPDDDALTPYRPVRMERHAIPLRDLASMTFRHDVTVDLDQLLQACPIDKSGWKPGIA